MHQHFGSLIAFCKNLILIRGRTLCSPPNPYYLEKSGIILRAGALDPVSQFSQFGNQQVPVLPLDFNRSVFNCAARTTALLEFQGKSFQLTFRQRNPRNKGNNLPFAPFGAAGNSDNSVLFG